MTYKFRQTGVAILAFLILFVLGFACFWLFAKPDSPVAMVDAQVIAFENRYLAKNLTIIKFARLRLLSEDKERLVSWPEGRALNCNPGDRVRLEQHGNELRLPPQICNGI
jgi:hypothetical protein